MNQNSLVKLSDYQPYPFKIPEIKLDFYIYQKYVRLISIQRVEPVSQVDNILVLQGINLDLERITINHKEIANHQYKLTSSSLIIYRTPSTTFDLKIIVRLDPFNNTSLEGLYLSKSILATQCEAEGFRRICFQPDRP